jgi:hypothetical protein
MFVIQVPVCTKGDVQWSPAISNVSVHHFLKATSVKVRSVVTYHSYFFIKPYLSLMFAPSVFLMYFVFNFTVPHPCHIRPCLNGALCVDSFSGYNGYPSKWNHGSLHYLCICRPGYSGLNCEGINRFCGQLMYQVVYHDNSVDLLQERKINW